MPLLCADCEQQWHWQVWFWWMGRMSLKAKYPCKQTHWSLCHCFWHFLQIFKQWMAGLFPEKGHSCWPVIFPELLLAGFGQVSSFKRRENINIWSCSNAGTATAGAGTTFSTFSVFTDSSTTTGGDGDFATGFWTSCSKFSWSSVTTKLDRPKRIAWESTRG